MICPDCNVTLPDHAFFCAACGHRVRVAHVRRRSRVAAPSPAQNGIPDPPSPAVRGGAEFFSAKTRKLAVEAASLSLLLPVLLLLPWFRLDGDPTSLVQAMGTGWLDTISGPSARAVVAATAAAVIGFNVALRAAIIGPQAIRIKGPAWLSVGSVVALLTSMLLLVDLQLLAMDKTALKAVTRPDLLYGVLLYNLAGLAHVMLTGLVVHRLREEHEEFDA